MGKLLAEAPEPPKETLEHSFQIEFTDPGNMRSLTGKVKFTLEVNGNVSRRHLECAFDATNNVLLKTLQEWGIRKIHFPTSKK